MKFLSLADQLAECTDDELRAIYAAGNAYWEKSLDTPTTPFAEICEMSNLSITSTWEIVVQEIIRRWLNTSRK